MILEYRHPQIAVSGTHDVQTGELWASEIQRRMQLVHARSVGDLNSDELAIGCFVRKAAAGDRVEFMEYCGDGRIVCVTNVAVLLFEGRNPVGRFDIDHVQDVQRLERNLQLVVEQRNCSQDPRLLQ
jgi:hypothetical protein